MKLFSQVWGERGKHKYFNHQIQNIWTKYRVTVLEGCFTFVLFSYLCSFFCLYRLFHHQTLRCQFLSQCPTTTVWYTVTQSAPWETPTFYHWLILLCKGIACLLVWHIGLQVQVTQVGSAQSHPFKCSAVSSLHVLGLYFKLYSKKQELYFQ